MSVEELPVHRKEDAQTDRDEVTGREDLYICLNNEKQVRDVTEVLENSKQYTGISLRIKNLTPEIIENVTNAIE